MIVVLTAALALMTFGQSHAAPIAMSFPAPPSAEIDRVRLVCEQYWNANRLRLRCYRAAREGLSPRYPIFRSWRYWWWTA